MFKVKCDNDWLEEYFEEKVYIVYAIKIIDNKTKFLIYDKEEYWEWVDADNYVPIEDGE